ncbi:MAG: NAD(P)H-hydrate dehydratase [Chlamydiales bacterium]|nr:NAD(P)H-hydrate dehydratase [Chlamydiales bacterium]
MTHVLTYVVLTAQETASLEEMAVAGGYSREALMQQAARRVADIAQKYTNQQEKILLFVGKGNKGGDALAAGAFLLQEGFSVEAFCLYSSKDSSPLNQQMRRFFEEKGGRVFSDDVEMNFYGLIIDGLLGTGFRGTLSPDLAAWIQRINSSDNPCIAIDLPSGLNGTTGEGADEAIQATATVALGCAKSGFFLRNGWNCVGKLYVEDIGFPSVYLQKAKIFAELCHPTVLKLPHLVRNRHKYQAGYVVGYGGSKQFSGAPKLSSLAALRSGAGMIRLFHPDDAEMEHSFFELIHTVWDEAAWNHELTRASSVFVGPGLGRIPNMKEWLIKHLAHVDVPCVLDADALIPDPSSWPKQVVLTPHRGEVLPLISCKEAPSDEELFIKCQALSDRTGAVIVLKGGPSFIFGPKRTPLVIPYGDPGMATAGSGDVLTGMIAAFLAQGLSCWDGAVLGATLHALAGERAAKKKSSYALIASDLIDELGTSELWNLFER